MPPISTFGTIRENVRVGDLVHADGSKAKSIFNSFIKVIGKELYYPIKDGVFLLLPGMALLRPSMRGTYADRLSGEESIAVMNFYDNLGWTRAESGAFVDADINEDFRSVSRNYIRSAHLRVNSLLPEGGKYIVDVASGPLQYDEYLTYSEHFERRVCCDISFEALRLAKSRIGDRGVYLQCDITRMPIRTGAVDGFVSLHTIYHLPADRQGEAFEELERITASDGRGVVVYSWDENSAAMKMAAMPKRMARSAVSLLKSIVKVALPRPILLLLRARRQAPQQSASAPVQAASTYCFHAHDFRWYRQNVAGRGGWTLHSWRSLSVEFLQSAVPDTQIGRAFLSAISVLEAKYPAFFGRIGQYPMFAFDKSTSRH